MVNKEIFWQQDLQAAELDMFLVRCERAQAGGWSMVVRICGCVELSDGRLVRVNREIRLGNLKQEGRKPGAGLRGGRFTRKEQSNGPTD